MIWELSVIATALLIIGLTGQGFEIRKMKRTRPTYLQPKMSFLASEASNGMS